MFQVRDTIPQVVEKTHVRYGMTFHGNLKNSVPSKRRWLSPKWPALAVAFTGFKKPDLGGKAGKLPQEVLAAVKNSTTDEHGSNQVTEKHFFINNICCIVLSLLCHCVLLDFPCLENA